MLFSENGNDNDDSNSNNIAFTIIGTKLCVSVNFLANDLIYKCIAMNIKQKVKVKTRQTSIDFFLN